MWKFISKQLMGQGLVTDHWSPDLVARIQCFLSQHDFSLWPETKILKSKLPQIETSEVTVTL